MEKPAFLRDRPLLADDDGSTVFQCVGKQSFKTPELARKVASASSGRKDARITAYKCKICGEWHVGQSNRHKNRRMKIR